MGRSYWYAVRSIVFAACVLAGASSVHAQGIFSPPIASGVEDGIVDVLERRPETVRTELYAGGDMTGESWYLYSGMTQSLFAGIGQNGWRVRAVGGYGRYHYRGFLAIDGKAVEVPITGTQFIAEGLIGYQQRWGPLIAKVFAGISAQTHALSPVDIRNERLGETYGGKVALEMWLNIGRYGFASLDGWWSSNYGDIGVQGRAGMRMTNWLSLGLEVAWSGSNDYNITRGGGFVSIASNFGDVQLAGGISGNFEEDPSVYGSVAYQIKY